MKQIKIDEHYTLIPDLSSWGLLMEKPNPENINPKTGKPTVTRHKTYHSTLEQALKKYLDYKIKDGIENDAVNSIEKIFHAIDTSVKILKAVAEVIKTNQQ